MKLIHLSDLHLGKRVYISPVYNGTVTPVTLEDAFGPCAGETALDLDRLCTSSVATPAREKPPSLTPSPTPWSGIWRSRAGT